MKVKPLLSAAAECAEAWAAVGHACVERAPRWLQRHADGIALVCFAVSF